MYSKVVICIMLTMGLIFSLFIALSNGPISVPLSIFWQSDEESQFLVKMWLHIRLPRILLAILVGAALSVSGAILQGVFKNPLADPGLLGISSGASLAVAIVIIFQFSLPTFMVFWGTMVAAFLGSIVITLIIFIVAQLKSTTLSQLLLFGIAINALCASAIGVLAYISNDQQLREISLWGMGSLSNIHWQTLFFATAIIIPVIILISLIAQRLNLLQLGEEDAHYLGINVRQTQIILLISSAILVAVAVSLAGIIGFVGLVVPHIIRLIIGVDHRWLLPCSALGGAILLLIADTVARTVAAPAIIPIGLLTCLIGAPGFLIIIMTRKNRSD